MDHTFSQIAESEQFLRDNKMCLMINPINQIENGYEEQVAKGEMPLITYTAIIYDENIENIIADLSLDSLSEAISWSLDWIANNIQIEKLEVNDNEKR